MNAILRTIRGLFSRPLTNTSQPDVPSPLDVEDVWGWGGNADVGLFPGTRRVLVDAGSVRDADRADRVIRRANGARS